jgi:integrase
MARPKKTNTMSPYMEALKVTLKEKYSEGTANLYLVKLRILNRDKPFTSLAFLKNHTKLLELMNAVENVNTRKSYMTAVVGVLESINIPAYNKINVHYKNALNTFKVDYNKIDKNEKSATQSKNWIEWSEVEALQKKLAATADKVTKNDIDNNNGASIDALEQNLLLSLYTMIPPRRNADFYEMVIGKAGEKNKNYYDGDKFILNVFKTSRSRGSEIIEVPDNLKKVVDNYIQLMRLKDGHYLLYNGSKRSPIKITRELNHIFGKKISSSMLRHIWNTHLFGDVIDKIKENSIALGHSMGMDLQYVKTD